MGEARAPDFTFGQIYVEASGSQVNSQVGEGSGEVGQAPNQNPIIQVPDVP